MPMNGKRHDMKFTGDKLDVHNDLNAAVPVTQWNSRIEHDLPRQLEQLIFTEKAANCVSMVMQKYK